MSNKKSWKYFPKTTIEKGFLVLFDNKYIEYKSEDEEKPLFEEYPKSFRLCLHDMINGLKKSGLWKINLTMKRKFISAKVNNEEHMMQAKHDNRKIKAISDKIVEELFDLLVQTYQLGQE